MTTMTTSTFVPQDFDPSDFANIEPLGRELLERRIGSLDELRQWVRDLSALCATIWEYGSRTDIDNACFTEDDAKEQALLNWLRHVQPKLKPMMFELRKRYLKQPQRWDLTEPGFHMMELDWQAEVDLFREENVPLQTQDDELQKDYGKIMGAMLVEFRGQRRTLQQMGKFLEDPDRATREEAWLLVAQRRLEDRAPLDELFQQLVDLRHRMAQQADFENFRDYMWKAKKRFDYTPAECEAFAEGVEQVVVPVLKQIDAQRREVMQLQTLRPWDTAVDPLGRPGLNPFDPDDIDEFVEKTRVVFERVSPQLGRWFASLRENGNLDLGSRRGKRPGGFQAYLPASKQPFIFMNAAGVQRDVETLLHEGGHAFHSLAAHEEWNVFVHQAPLEFCEVASMSMELITLPHYAVYFDNEEDIARARRKQLEGALQGLPWIARIDQFQHWMYTHPEHTLEQRNAKWVELDERFDTGVIDWSGLEAERASSWHRVLHLFQVPFYYIEYGIAQIGALGTWLNYRRDADKTLKDLLAAFALGGTRPLPELFRTAGLPFEFDGATMKPIVEAVQQELEALPV